MRKLNLKYLKTKINRAILLFYFLLFLLILPGDIGSVDTVTHMFLAKKIVTERSISFTLAENKILEMPLTQNRENKRFYPVYNFGYAILLIPGILLSILIRKILAVSYPNFPFSKDFIYFFYTALLSIVTSLILVKFISSTVFLLSKKKKKHPSIKDLLLIFFLFLSTNLFVYTHSIISLTFFAFFFYLAFYFLLLYFKRIPTQRNYLILFSLFFTITASVYNASFILTIPALYVYVFLEIFLRKKSNKPKTLLFFTFSLLPAIFIQLFWNYLRFKNPLSSGYLEYGIKIYEFNKEKFLQRLFGLTFSPSKGVFIYNPLTITALLFTFFVIIKKVKSFLSLALFFLILLITYLFHYSLVIFWHGDVAYGPRYLAPILPFVILLSSLFFKQLIESKHIILKSIAISLFGLIVFIGIYNQIPGILIPHFYFGNIKQPEKCKKYENYYFSWECSRIKTGWEDILTKRLIITREALYEDRLKTFFISELSFPLRLQPTQFYPWVLKLPTEIYFSTPEDLDKALELRLKLTFGWNPSTAKYKWVKYRVYLNNSRLKDIKLTNLNWQKVSLVMPQNLFVRKRNNVLKFELVEYEKNHKPEAQHTKTDLIILSFKIDGYHINMRNFRTIYPDPIFNKFSPWKTSDYQVAQQVYQSMYNRFYDLLFLRLLFYQNI